MGKSCTQLALWSLCYQLQHAPEHFPHFHLCFWLLRLTTENWAAGAIGSVVTASSVVTRSVERCVCLLTSRQLPLLFLEWVWVNPPEKSPVRPSMPGVLPFINNFFLSSWSPPRKQGFLGWEWWVSSTLTWAYLPEWREVLNLKGVERNQSTKKVMGMWTNS